MALEGLSTMFLNPKAYNILPFKNYDTDDGKPEITSFFIPAHKFALTSEYLDNRGVTDHIRFKEYYLKQREKLTDKDFQSEAAEHCFTPREALSKHGDNIFDPVALSERMVQIKVQNDYIKPVRMQLLWDSNQKIIARESPSSNLLVVEPPLTDESGKPYKNLYVAGIDSIDIGSGDSTSDSNRSDYCVVVKKRIFGMNDPKYVAMYKCRPEDIRQAYDLTIKLLTWYNCQAMLEATRMGIKTYFDQNKKSHLLMARPQSALSTTSKKTGNRKLIGVPSSTEYIKHGLELVNNFVNDFWYTIDFEEMVDQLLNYSYESKGKFDIVAALAMAEYGDEDMYGINPTTVVSVKSQWQDIGWFTDENGYKRRGVIPKGHYETNRKWY